MVHEHYCVWPELGFRMYLICTQQTLINNKYSFICIFVQETYMFHYSRKVLLGPVCLSPLACVDFLPQFKDVHVWLTGDPKLAIFI